MSPSYFTIIHILVLCLIFVISMLLLFLSLKSAKKIFFSLLLTNVLVSTVLAVFMMLVIDKYTKKGVLEDVKSQRVLRNETIVFKGVVRNVGRFSISACKFSAKLINQPLNGQTLKGESLFKSSGLSLFSWLFKDDEDKNRPNVLEHSFAVAKDLGPKKSINFTVTMPFPSYFSKTMTITKLNCY